MPFKESLDSSDYDEESSKSVWREKGPSYDAFNPRIPMKYIEFEPGLLFTSVSVVKHAVIDYVVEQKRNIWFSKNDLLRVQAKCRPNCPWYLYASKIDVDGTFQIKTYNKQHSCILVHKHSFVRSDWLERKFRNQIRANPKWKLREFQQNINEMHALIISKNQCWLTKKLALSKIKSEIGKQYKRLYDYEAEILRSNPGNTVKFGVEKNDSDNLGTFKRMYIYFTVVKEGFAQGCRKFIGLDGCFLKSFMKGELLAAIGRDGNNQMFPISWAIVDFESTEAKTSTLEEFKLIREEIKGISPLAHYDLLKTEPRYWSRAYFDTLTYCDMVHNNLSECFNSWIVEARYKPILELLDDIRLKIMERLHVRRDFMLKNDCVIGPQIIKKLNYSIEATRFCKSIWTGADECEVKDIDGGQWVVNMVKNTCSCRRWELRGYPCSHGYSALFAMNEKQEEKINECYSRDVYMKAYDHMLKPMKGALYWPNTGFPDILPPKSRRMPGRPKKNKKREQGESGAGIKLGKKGVRMTCSKCLMFGHNKASCKTSEEEVKERHKREAAEVKKAQVEGARAHAAEIIYLKKEEGDNSKKEAKSRRHK
ncbi:uncharacterized protein LOC141661151 [Apium graveolens]|uniref:uncharacterized protein LOC141661151 n=1 Tax=Apium graveolens TaxID=4045 RepID=UPI003D7BA02D